MDRIHHLSLQSDSAITILVSAVVAPMVLLQLGPIDR